MKIYHFKNDQSTTISPSGPNQVSSTILVEQTGGQITDLNVKIDLTHSYTSDLILSLRAPNGVETLLALRRGGSGDNFEDTTFDDEAPIMIAEGSPPFRDIFRPEEPLSSFNGPVQNGNWTLRIDDRATQDGGSLNSWELELVTDEQADNLGPFVFHNQNQQNILSSGPNSIQSTIQVQGLTGITAAEVSVTVDIDHSFTRDLKMSLVSAQNTSVILVENEGGDGDHFRQTNFDDAAAQSITEGAAPFTGTFRPEGQLSDFNGEDPNGTWTLIVEDQANLDGGILKSWSLAIKSDQTPDAVRPYRIWVEFEGGLSASQQSIFQSAADRWGEIIDADLPPIADQGGPVDLVIKAKGENIDGPGGTLGAAGPTRIRSSNSRPVEGIMRFDSADLTQMENNGELLDVIIHEMGHVLGIGTLWDHLGLIVQAGNNDPQFTGSNAMREYATLKNLPNPTTVPVANTGGQGTAGGHWRESVFDTELMTGYDDPGRNALSRLTIASLQDIGYVVNYEKADTYILPFGLLSSMAIANKTQHLCRVEVPDFEVVPDDNI